MRLDGVSGMFAFNVFWLPEISQSADMFVSLSDINFAIVDTKVVGWAGNDVSLKVVGDSWGLEGGN